jgi:hypothetical protein
MMVEWRASLRRGAMIQVTADESVKALLGTLEQAAEIRDDGGTLLGYYTPAKVEAERLRQKIRAEFDPEEIARRKASKERGLTTAEVLEYLRSLGAP